MINKIIVMQFRYLGDAVLITPSLNAIHAQFPNSELHILVAEEIAPIFENLSFIKKVWAIPRSRGKVLLRKTLPIINSLRKEHFDISIDFEGNDRGAILSLLINAKTRIAPLQKKSSFLKKLSYNKAISFNRPVDTWVKRNLELVTFGLGIKVSEIPKLNIESSPLLLNEAKKIMSGYKFICHVGTSQEKKEWPVKKWFELYRLAEKSGYKIVFSAGPGEREQILLGLIKELDSDIPILPPIFDLPLFLAVLNQADLVISGDTGPLHLASALGKKVIGLFAVEDGVKHYAPIYKKNEIILGNTCTCNGDLNHYAVCKSRNPCMNSISPEQVFELIKKRYLP